MVLLFPSIRAIRNFGTLMLIGKSRALPRQPFLTHTESVENHGTALQTSVVAQRKKGASMLAPLAAKLTAGRRLRTHASLRAVASRRDRIGKDPSDCRRANSGGWCHRHRTTTGSSIPNEGEHSGTDRDRHSRR